MKLRVLYIGCVEFSYAQLENLLQKGCADVIGIVTKRSSSLNADFCSLEPLAIRHNIPLFFADGTHQGELMSWMKQMRPDVIYCFGWSSLLKRDILQIPRLGVIGYHPAALPQNRGRHPIVWALALGLQKTASTFFFMDEGADSGDILNQVEVIIDPDDDAALLYRKLISLAKGQVELLTKQLTEGAFPRVPQDPSKANAWRKRGRHDGEIDWRMSSSSIYNLVRALTRPYIGAHFCHGNHEVKVWQARSVNEGSKNIEPGKVLDVKGNAILVKCGEGGIMLMEHELASLPRIGDYL